MKLLARSAAARPRRSNTPDARGAPRPVSGRREMRIFLGVVSVAVLAALLPEASISATKASEHKVKAAFLVNFARYVKWPSTAFDSATDPIVIGIYGDGILPKVLEHIAAGKEVDGRSLKVVECSDVDQAVNSHILFIGSSRAEDHLAIIEATRHASVFSVSDSPGFAKAGGVANFVLLDSRVRFEINDRAAKEAGLTVSSRLLRLAMLSN
jgi:hypothetical protein